MMREKQAIHNIIFDFGGVLIGWDPHIVYNEHFNGDQEKARWFISNICKPEWNAEFDRGYPFEKGINEKVQEFPEFETEIRIYRSKWEDMLTGAIEGTVQLLNNLHQNDHLRLFGITNWSHETFPIALKRFGFLNTFEDIVVSGEVKMIKPNRDIFLHAINRFKIKPDESLFIDDNEANIRTALQIGFEAHHFINPEGLKKDLHRRGLI